MIITKFLSTLFRPVPFLDTCTGYVRSSRSRRRRRGEDPRPVASSGINRLAAGDLDPTSRSSGGSIQTPWNIDDRHLLLFLLFHGSLFTIMSSPHSKIQIRIYAQPKLWCFRKSHYLCFTTVVVEFYKYVYGI